MPADQRECPASPICAATTNASSRNGITPISSTEVPFLPPVRLLLLRWWHLPTVALLERTDGALRREIFTRFGADQL